MQIKDKIINIIEDIHLINVNFTFTKDKPYLEVVHFKSATGYFFIIKADTLKDILDLLNGKVIKCCIELKKRGNRKVKSINAVDFIEFIEQRQHFFTNRDLKRVKS